MTTSPGIAMSCAARLGAVALGSVARAEVEPGHDDGVPELPVMASGCLGLISFPREPGRVTLEWIETQHPRLMPTLRDHPGIAFILVRSERARALAIGPGGTHHLEDRRIEGEDPLAP